MSPGRPEPIQVAFQGGGAKIFSLLPVVAALQDAESDGLIRVTRVAGTSAGAIAGSLLACGVDVAKCRPALGAARQSLASELKPPGTWAGITRFLRGRPLIDLGILARALQIMGLKNVEIAKAVRGDTQLVIVSSDIKNGKACYSSPEDHLLEQVLDSCAFPFVLRSFAASTSRFDGGLCHNLPTDVLVNVLPEPDLGPVIGIGFGAEAPSPGERVKRLGAFSGDVLRTVMNVLSARQESCIPEHALYEVPTSTATFDFLPAFDAMLDDDTFAAMKATALKWVKETVSSISKPLVRPPRVSIDEAASAWADVAERLAPDDFVVRRRSVLHVTIGALSGDGVSQDTVKHRHTIYSGSKPIARHRILLGNDAHMVADCTTMACCGSEVIPCETVPVCDDGLWGLDVYFEPAVEPEQELEVILSETRVGAMKELWQGKPDFAGVIGITEHDEAYIVLTWPNELAKADGLAAAQRQNPRGGENRQHDEVLTSGSVKATLGIDTGHGQHSMAWRCKDLGVGEYFGLLFVPTGS